MRCTKLNSICSCAMLKTAVPHLSLFSERGGNQVTCQDMPNEQATDAQSTSLSSAYSPWLGKPVAIRVSSVELETTLRGIVIGESEAAVRVRIGGIWDVDIYKDMILSVEDSFAT